MVLGEDYLQMEKSRKKGRLEYAFSAHEEENIWW